MRLSRQFFVVGAIALWTSVAWAVELLRPHLQYSNKNRLVHDGANQMAVHIFN